MGGKERRRAAAMAEVVISRTAARQIAKFRNFYKRKDSDVGNRAVATILSAFRILTKHSAAGRPALTHPGLRELVIPFGAAGYVALYRIDAVANRVVILAIRHQREAGYEALER